MHEILGGYDHFITTLFRDLAGKGIFAAHWPIDHICYRVTTHVEYQDLKKRLLPFCKAIATTRHNNREFSIFHLQDKYALRVDSLAPITLLELPSPGGKRPYPAGLEHAEFVVSDNFIQFCRRHRDALSAPNMAEADPTSFITFPTGATAKFHTMSLADKIRLQGDRFVPL